MKNLLKKISAVAMAFTLLGTGSTLAKTSTKPVKTLTAHAIDYCPEHNGVVVNYPKYFYDMDCSNVIFIIYYYRQYKETHCAVCNKLLSKEYCGLIPETKWIWNL